MMNVDEAKAYISTVLQFLHEKEVPLHKVVVHKFLYFIDTKGIKLGFRFEPYTYGPFSFDVASTLSSMVFWKEVNETHSDYAIVDLDRYNRDDELLGRIENIFSTFENIADKQYDFKTMEIFGTALYCAETLNMIKGSVAEDSIIADFKEWKKDKYSDAEVRPIVSRLIESLQE